MNKLFKKMKFNPRKYLGNLVSKVSNAYSSNYYPNKDTKSTFYLNEKSVPSENKYKNNRLRTAATYSMAFATAQHPDVMLGPIPFYTAQMIEVASSEDVLKFRSVGAQFLAHQHGGNYAIRIDLKLIGETAPYMLHILNFLHQYGDLEEFMNPIAETDWAALDPRYVGTANEANWEFPHDVSQTKLGKEDIQRTKEIGKDLNEDVFVEESRLVTWTNLSDISYLTSDWHKTFTIVTRAEVLFDMYIESMIYWRSVDESPDVINVSILCRRFTPPPIIENASIEVEYIPTAKTAKMPAGKIILKAKRIPKGKSVSPSTKVETGEYQTYFKKELTSRLYKAVDSTPRYLDKWGAKWDIVANFIHRFNPFMRERYTSRIESQKTIMIKNRAWFLGTPVYRAMYFGFNIQEKIKQKNIGKDKIDLHKIKNGVIIDVMIIDDSQLTNITPSNKDLIEPYFTTVKFDDVSLTFFNSGLKTYVSVRYKNGSAKQSVIYIDSYYVVSTIKNTSEYVIFRLNKKIAKGEYKIDFWGLSM